MRILQASSHKKGQLKLPFDLACTSGTSYIVQCNAAIGVAGLQPFLGVSSLNFGPLATAAFFLECFGLAGSRYDPQVPCS